MKGNALYAIKESKEYNADYVCIEGNKTYICKMNPDMVNYESNEPVENQPVWNITCIEQTTTENGSIITTKYPNGHSSLYEFRAAACNTYEYQYQK